MKRREFIALFGGSVAWPVAAGAQDAGRTYRLGMMFPFPRDSRESVGIVDALIAELGRNGFVEGQNLTIQYRAWAPHVDLISDYAADLAARPLDVFAVGGPVAVRAVQKATKTMPILAITDDMIGEGVVKSMARPDGNITGVSILATELDGKRQEILIEVVPGARRIAALADTNTTAPAQLEALQREAKARNIELSIQRVDKAAEIPGALEAVKGSGAAALNVLASPVLHSNLQLILERVAALRLPAIFQWPEIAEEGGFVAYGPRFTQIVRDLYARQLVQLFRGVKAADIPVEQPSKFELAINLKTANALGVTVPPAIVARADKVIE
ncbi:MAG: ABC transporter substrate-binding protein [Betaproteobacteria bacterium]